MPFIPLDLEAQGNPLLIGLLVICGAGSLFFLILAVVYFRMAKNTPKERRQSYYWQAAIGVTLAAVTPIVGLVLASIPPDPQSTLVVKMKLNADKERIPEIQREVKEAYGLKLTDRETHALDYPYEKPTEDFEVYGSFDKKDQVAGSQFEKSTVYLVWVDGAFDLSESSDGESFTPLEAAK